MRFLRHPAFALLLAPMALAAVEEAAPAPAPAPPAQEDAAPDWTWTGAFGAFVTSVSSANEETSRDPTIAGTTDTVGYRLSLETGVDLRAGRHSLDQDLVAKYGRKREDGRAWVEDTDDVRYDGVWRYTLRAPHFTYVSWGWESVFTGPEPDQRAFDPGLLKAGAGYGQLYEDLLPIEDKLEGRIGASVRKRYGRDLRHEDTEPVYGGEVFLRYERTQTAMLRYFAQYEGFLEFEDPGHVINVISAGLNAQLATLLTVELGLRAYYESLPEDEADGTPGFSEWSWRQDTVVGLQYRW